MSGKKQDLKAVFVFFFVPRKSWAKAEGYEILVSRVKKRQWRQLKWILGKYKLTGGRSRKRRKKMGQEMT